jgi:hypothetical protein
VSLRMLTNLRLADLRLITAQQRTSGQNLPSDLYINSPVSLRVERDDPWQPSARGHPAATLFRGGGI